MNKKNQRIFAVMRKETIHLIRDRHTLIMMIFIPVIEMFLLAYSATFTILHLPMAIYDPSNDEQSRTFIDSLVNSEYFDVVFVAESQQQVIDAIDASKAKAGLILPTDFNSHIARGDGNLLLLLDGSDSFSLQSSYGAISSIAQDFSLNIILTELSRQGAGSSSLVSQENLPLTTYVKSLYNPTRNNLIFIIPGVAVMLLQMFSILGIGMTIVREREWGEVEQLLSTPIRPLENIIGKIIPYLALSFFELMIIHLIGYFWFRVPFEGNIFLYLLLAFLFVSASLSIGLFISTMARTQKQIQMISSMILLLSFLLSGVVFSRIPMPLWTKIIGDLLPVTHFIPIARGIMIKGVGIHGYWVNIGALFLLSLFQFLLLPVLTRKRMD